MGDCGQFDANVRIEYSVKQKEENTEEAITAFLESKKFMFEEEVVVSKKAIRDLYAKNIAFKLEYAEWDEWYSEQCTVEEMLEVLDDYSDDSSLTLTTFTLATTDDMKYVNLEAIKDLDTIGYNLVDRKNILEVYGSIYCGNDNSTDDAVDVSKIQKYLALPAARLVLTGDGSGNC